MSNFNIIDTSIEGLKIVEPFLVRDERGYYIKTFEKDIFKQLGLNIGIQELCGSISKKGVIRGLHFQTKHAQSKLVRCAYGIIYDVAVDLRPDSKTFGKWFGIELSHYNNQMLFIPAGFAHGLMALSDEAVLSYHSAEKYVKDWDYGIRWDDKDLGITWPLERVNADIIISEKDKHLVTFKEYCKMIGR